MASISSDAPTRKKFHTAGVVNPSLHYVIDRSEWHASLADHLAGGAFTLLHAHRQAGKSSAAGKVASLLQQRDDKFRVLACTMENVRAGSASVMWQALASTLRLAIVVTPLGRLPKAVSAMVSSDQPLFTDATSFEDFFSGGIWGELRVILVIDEFDTLLDAPSEVRQELLVSLRALRTVDSIAPEHSPTALHAVLGIGVYRLLQFSSGEARRFHSPPFNISDSLTVPPTSQEQVDIMLADFSSSTGYTVPKFIAEDMLWRSGGHVGLLSLLGQQLARLCDTLDPGSCIDEGMWAVIVGGSGLVGELRESATVASMLRSVSGRMDMRLIQEARAIVRIMLSAPDDVLLDISDGDYVNRKALDCLLAEGVIIARTHAGQRKHRIIAPMVAPLLMKDIGSTAMLAQVPRVPFPRWPDGSLRLQQTILEALPFLDLGAIFHSCSLLKRGQPCENAYHSQLFDILSHRLSEGGWRVLGETRNAFAPGPLRRLDLLIASNGQRCGIELLVDSASFYKHVDEQAGTYLAQQGLASVIVVNFVSSSSPGPGIVLKLRKQLPQGVELLQVLVDRTAMTVTPYALADDGLTSNALASIQLNRSSGGAAMEPLHSQFAALTVGAPAATSALNVAYTRVDIAGSALLLSPEATVKDLLTAVAEDIDARAESLSVWLVQADEGTRVVRGQLVSVMGQFVRQSSASRLEVRRAAGPPLLLTLR